MLITKKAIILFFCCMLMTGCVKTKVIDDVELIMTMGYDWNSTTQNYKGTAVAPLYGSSEQANMRDNIRYTGSADTFQDINAMIQTKAPFQVEVGNLLSVIFGEELAKKGIQDIVMGISEDPAIGRNLYLAIADGTAEEMLNQEYKLEHTLPRFLEQLIDTNTQSMIPKMNLHQFNYRLIGEGMDPFLPILKASTPSIDIVGIGFLKGDKLVHRINYDQFFIFHMLYKDTKGSAYEFDQETTEDSIAIKSIRSNRKVTWKSKDHVEISEDIIGTLVESDKMGVKTFEEKRKLEKNISDHLEKQGDKLAATFQKLEIDPLMIGASARSQFRNWNLEEWKKSYPDIKITTKVKFNLEINNISR
ncbi:Ger(x)C family spore germination protein [Gracilibacillus salinarum]|uniref:Ger(X)C family spore germination protein n=1 Tax=Gracilibacillus salinarum TaxID=2932255 RepID=A0ABY4GLP0_9BACI|nr:Ger(x)C family spore germination protein [Gracilibacillus salinarum]UOQ85283.1 Ger(x)C family spore germination protein [Gracilibacillus salinarum]